VKESVEKEFGAKSTEFFKLYPADNETTAVRSWEDFHGDRFYLLWHMEVAGSASDKEQAAPVYRYRFDWRPHAIRKVPKEWGAYHSAEMNMCSGRLSGEFLRCGEAKTAR